MYFHSNSSCYWGDILQLNANTFMYFTFMYFNWMQKLLCISVAIAVAIGEICLNWRQTRLYISIAISYITIAVGRLGYMKNRCFKKWIQTLLWECIQLEPHWNTDKTGMLLWYTVDSTHPHKKVHHIQNIEWIL